MAYIKSTRRLSTGKRDRKNASYVFLDNKIWALIINAVTSTCSFTKQEIEIPGN